MIHSNNTTMPGSLPDSVPPTPANSSNLQDNNVNTNISHNDENAAVGDKRYPDATRPNQPQVSSINNQTQNYLNKSDPQYQVDNNYSTRDPGFTNNMSPKHDEHHQMGNMQSMGMNPNHNNPISNSHDRKEHHYKRDAALGAGAAGLAGHEIKNHHDNQDHEGVHSTGSNNVPTSEDHHYKRDAALGAGAAGLAGHEIKNHHDNQENEGVHSMDSNNVPTSEDHHYKRDAALGAGAAGLAGHEMKNHHDNQEHEGVHFDNSTQVSGDHHRRDAALGAGAAGVAGHEMKKHHDENKQEEGNNSVHSSVEGGEEGEKKGKDAEQHKKPLNTGGDSHRIAEQEPMGMGGLTGKQPVGEVNFKKL